MATSRPVRKRLVDIADRVITGVMTGLREIIILVLDLSGSMDERDWKPSRLQGAKDAGIALLEEKLRTQPVDKVGVVSFATDARIEQLPLSVGTHMDRLSCVVTQLKARGRTDIGAGLVETERAFNGRPSFRRQLMEKGLLGWLMSPGAPRAVEPPAASTEEALKRAILLSDGDHNGSIDPFPVAERLKLNGVEINCIGIGGTRKEVNEDLLKTIASRGPTGLPLYWYIGERPALIRKFEELANGLRAIEH